MYQRKTAIPFYKGDKGMENMTDAQNDQMGPLEEKHSICDSIMELTDANKQPMEVIEHILHHVTMVGLHYALYDQWGVSSDST